MSRNLDPTLAAALPGNIMPVILAALTFKSGVAYAWSGVGDLAWNGNTFKGVGALGGVSPISEGSSVKADGTSVKLSGLSPASLVPPALPSGVTPPIFPVPAGMQVAWVVPTHAVPFADPTQGIAACTVGNASLEMTSTSTFGPDVVSATWSGFEPPLLPSDAVVHHAIPVALLSGTGSGAINGGFLALPLNGTPPFSGQYLGNDLFTLAAMEAASVVLEIAGSGPHTFLQTLDASFIAIAVYYSSASGGVSLVQETLGDVQLGAPAQIWFGLMQDGALLGTPYLVFSGTVDQPTVKVGADTIDFNLALENRLSNLQRANQRRYTAADQHIAYPDDTAFNWVEILNDEALRWG